MKTLILALAMFSSSLAFAGSKCFLTDQQFLIKEAGGASAISHIDLKYDLLDLLDSNGKKTDEVQIGHATFGAVYKGTDVSAQKVVCVRINGQAYGSDSCQMCAILN